MYLNLCCIIKQWLYNALNKAVDENSLPYQSFFCHSPELQNQATPHTKSSKPLPPNNRPNQNLAVYRKSQNDLYIL